METTHCRANRYVESSWLVLFVCLYLCLALCVADPFVFVTRGRVYIYISFWRRDNHTPWYAARVARGGCDTSPPTIGKHSLFGVTWSFGYAQEWKMSGPHRTLPISNTTRTFIARGTTLAEHPELVSHSKEVMNENVH